MDSFKNGWFSEVTTKDHGHVLSLKVKKILYHQKSQYQDILVFESTHFGRVLVLDDSVQCTEIDEFTYQEMISFLPLNCHLNPQKVLIIGGGDGGVAREVSKHPLVETIIQCEIDEQVVNVAKEYLPFTAIGFKSPKLTLNICDGLEFMKQNENEFDVIITDSSDPKGPAVSLFKKPYYEAIKKALKPNGILCSQGESIWFDMKLIAKMNKFCKELFPVVDYSSIYIPTYPGGQIGFLICSKDENCDLRKPIHKFSPEQIASMELRYYNPSIHEASFVHPPFLQKAFKDVNMNENEE